MVVLLLLPDVANSFVAATTNIAAADAWNSPNVFRRRLFLHDSQCLNAIESIEVV